MTTDKGFLKYKDVCFPYLFENDKLFLFPPNEDTWKRNTKSLIDSLNDLYNPDRKVQFIPQITLAAQSFSGKQVEFRIPEDFSNDNGFLSVDVISYYEYEDFTRHYTNTDEGKKVENTKNEICGFFLEGREIDYFLEAHQTFTTKLQFDENKSSLSSLTVESKKEKELICGEATLDGITITITASRYASFTNQALYPLEAKSRLVFQFDKPVDIEYIHNLYFSGPHHR